MLGFAGFDFKIAVFEDTNYPKNFGMVGVSDEKCEIAYLWIYAVDLDYICEADENEVEEFASLYVNMLLKLNNLAYDIGRLTPSVDAEQLSSIQKNISTLNSILQLYLN